MSQKKKKNYPFFAIGDAADGTINCRLGLKYFVKQVIFMLFDIFLPVLNIINIFFSLKCHNY